MKEDIYIQHNLKFYNTVTDAWIFILGKNLHYGYFQTQDMTLDDASGYFIDVLASHGNIRENSSILDVGCGIGTPAIKLAKKFNCKVIGISTSLKGVNLAKIAAKQHKLEERVSFRVAHAHHNGMMDSSFDFVWQMESSHLIADKKQLFSENHRVLRDKGKLLLCDLILKKELNFTEIYRYRKELDIFAYSRANRTPIPFQTGQ